MKKKSNYLIFLEKKGISLSIINPGSEEKALLIEDSLQAINLLKDEKIAILGGDILSEINGKLIYAYQLWGSEYISLNWYCDEIPNENRDTYLNRSYEIAKKTIIEANAIADNLNKKCYVALVTEYYNFSLE